MIGSIGAALREACATPATLPVAEARILLRHVLGCTAAHLQAHGEVELTSEAETRFLGLVARRAAGEPIAYLTGTREFYGRDFAVTADVLIPRPETELLVDLAIARTRDLPQPQLLDLGTGSGCVAVTLALELDLADITATDLSVGALAVARLNAARHGAVVRCLHSDWFSSLSDLRYHLIVANPPYIAANDTHLAQGDLRFEPQHALASGADGLVAIRCIVRQSASHLLPGGGLLFEHGYDQAEAARILLQESGFTQIEQHRDLAGIVRVSGGKRSS